MKEHLKNYIDESKTAEVRGLRILLEYFYATELFSKITKQKIKVISVFGSARTKLETYEYAQAYNLGALLYQSGYAVVTGASRGIMQAANQGVADAIAQEIVASKQAKNLKQAQEMSIYEHKLRQHSVGLSISLPKETENNPFVGVSATFHYFMVRKFFFGALSSGFIACEGGWGTRDELYEILTLVQTGKSPIMPIIYLSQDPRHLEQDLKHTLKKKYISPDDMHLIHLVKTPEAAAEIIRQFYRVIDEIKYERDNSVHLTLKKNLSSSLRKKVESLLKSDAVSRMTIEWKDKELLLNNYMPGSYGTLRRAVDLMNLSA